MMKILLVEDETDLGNVLSGFLRLQEFDVTLARSAEEALDTDPELDYAVCILDVMLPGMDGFELSKHIRRKHPDMPLIFLTARTLKEDRIRGLALGADDYICKPFEVEELVLRIRNILRRSQLVAPERTSLGSVTVSFDEMTISGEDGVHRLTVKESELLKYLYQRKNLIVDREKMLTELWGENDYFMGRSMDVFISRIRKYLKNARGVELNTIRGKGFILKVKD